MIVHRQLRPFNFFKLLCEPVGLISTVVSFGLNEEQTQIQQTALDFARDRMMEDAAKWDQEETLPGTASSPLLLLSFPEHLLVTYYTF